MGAVAMWMDFEIALVRQDQADLIAELETTGRNETKYQIGFLRDAAPLFLRHAREGALKTYQANLSTICRVKGVRDALAHGVCMNTVRDDRTLLKLDYKRHQLSLSKEHLERVAKDIDRCTGFFIEFRTWVNDPIHLAALETYQKRLRGIGADPQTLDD